MQGQAGGCTDACAWTSTIAVLAQHDCCCHAAGAIIGLFLPYCCAERSIACGTCKAQQLTQARHSGLLQGPDPDHPAGHTAPQHSPLHTTESSNTSAGCCITYSTLHNGAERVHSSETAIALPCDQLWLCSATRCGVPCCVRTVGSVLI
jgi:hypothetical protein